MSISRYIIAILFVFVGYLGTPSHATMTAYYVDFSVACGGDGLATTTAFCSMNNFTDVARTAGDIAFVRRGQATTTGIVAAAFTSDGTLNNPIVVSADYDDLWGDNKASAQTATPVFGSKFVALSASSTQFQTPNKWIWFAGDCSTTYNAQTLNPCEYAYEVASTSPNGIDLYLPYKGAQSGAGIAMTIASSSPVIGTVAGTVQIFTMSNDDYWYFKGLDLRSTNTAVIALTANSTTIFYDTIIQTDGTTAAWVTASTLGSFYKKVRTFSNSGNGITSSTGFKIEDSLFDCNNVASTVFFGTINSSSAHGYMKDSEVKNCTTFWGASATQTGSDWYFSNVKRNQIYTALSGGYITNLSFEDDFSVVGLNSKTAQNIGSLTTATTTISSTANLRSGGGAVNLLVFPPSGTGNTGISTKQFPHSYIKLFEYAIYTDTTSKTYSMWFNSTSTAQWARSPFTSTQTGSSTPELYIECEYYAEASGADRFLKRSNTADAADFDSVTTWEDVSVTCQPSQAGILYLRGWYAKPKEAGANWFYMDTSVTVQ